MAAFHEVQFPPTISYGATGGPRFNTSILTLASGFERRQVNWSKTRAEYDVSTGLKTQVDVNALLKFFYARNGRAYGFRFKDWTDYQSPNSGDSRTNFMTTNGSLNTFQLTKTYADSGGTFVRTITKPVSGTTTVYADAVLTADWSIVTSTGVVTLGVTLAATTGKVISAAFEFDVPCRFYTDDLRVTIDDIDNLSWGQIPIVEVRV